jgi:hypothetical protein
VHAGALVTVAPAVQAHAAAGLGIGGAFPNGLLVEGELRWAGAAAGGVVLSRLRLAALVGYRLRRGRFELVAAAGPSVEPWLVTIRGSLEPTRSADDGPAMAPLLGGLVSTSPGVHIARPRFALRVGARVDLAASVLPSGRAAAIRRSTPSRTLFTFGGTELMLGLGVALWL